MSFESHSYNLLDWRSEFKRLEGAYAPSTIRGYFSDLSHYEAWSLSRGLAPFPAGVGAVCAYLDGISGAVTPSTVRRRLYAISKGHRLLGLEDPTRFEDVNLTLRRIRRAKLCRPRQAKGMTQEYLQRFMDVQPDTPWGLRNRAMLSLGYDLLTRRSELIAIMTDDVVWRPDRTLRVVIRRSKSDPFGMGRIAFTSTRTADLVSAWLEWRGPDIGPLFCGIYQERAIDRALSPDTVKIVIKDAARRARLTLPDVNDFSGHSMRVGAAQDLLCRGLDTAAIMRAGWLQPVNVLARYLEFAEHNPRR